ncbi:unnamed protein product [Chondrus crispus]|uniref:Uncharacterized protein n=1 Tax=Chondrus crispus TaxID=2769 RepID=R7QCQ8_CHOCR|nr:unnamed protein product [Chondrus crispus]CDF35245.1 unnamed protein product [Chondrus crispus]|eukprot:XP_005715064.1 unnamed protein product [Chondrus crispus]
MNCPVLVLRDRLYRTLSGIASEPTLIGDAITRGIKPKSVDHAQSIKLMLCLKLLAILVLNVKYARAVETVSRVGEIGRKSPEDVELETLWSFHSVQEKDSGKAGVCFAAVSGKREGLLPGSVSVLCHGRRWDV